MSDKSREKNGSNANFISLTVTTTGDDIENEQFNIMQPIKVVFEKALVLVGGSSHADQFTLEFEDTPLDLDKSISDYISEFGWEDGVVLDLIPRPEVV